MAGKQHMTAATTEEIVGSDVVHGWGFLCTHLQK
jgi:hypothetical protein